MNLKDVIIHESLKLFSLQGFINTSVTDIIEAASTSKGGFYNHFASKEELFLEVLAEGQNIWRERTLEGLEAIESPVGKIKKLLENYKDRYLSDSDNFPGGCIFVTLSVELDDQLPHLCNEVKKGFVGLKGMLKRLLIEGQERGELRKDVNPSVVTELLFSGMLGTSIIFGMDKTTECLDRSINALIDHLEELKL